MPQRKRKRETVERTPSMSPPQRKRDRLNSGSSKSREHSSERETKGLWARLFGEDVDSSERENRAWRRAAAAPHMDEAYFAAKPRNSDSLERYLASNPDPPGVTRFPLRPKVHPHQKLYEPTPANIEAGIAGFPKQVFRVESGKRKKGGPVTYRSDLLRKENVMATFAVDGPGDTVQDMSVHFRMPKNTGPGLGVPFRVRRNHCRIKPGELDDNCFFRSVSQALYGTEHEADKVQQRVVSYIRGGRAGPLRAVPAAHDGRTDRTLAHIADDLDNNEQLADDAVVLLTAMAHGIEINALIENEDTVFVYKPDGELTSVPAAAYRYYYMNGKGPEPLVVFATPKHAEHAYFDRPRGDANFSRRKNAATQLPTIVEADYDPQWRRPEAWLATRAFQER